MRMRKDLEGHVRGVLKVFGVCMGAVRRTELRQWFRDQLAEAAATVPAIDVMADTFNPGREVLCVATDALDEDLTTIARESALARRLMTVSGVDPVVSLAFIAPLDDAERFSRSRDVGAFPGHAPRRHQSGEMDWSGRISNCGDRDRRRLLHAGATTLITQVRIPSPLLARAKRLQERKDIAKDAVATARKLAVVLHCIWRDGTVYDPDLEAAM